MIFLSYSLCPALEGNSDSVHAASPHSHIYICWSSFGLCSPWAGDADPICLISSEPLDSCPHLPLPHGVHNQLGWVLNKQQMRAWSRSHKYCLGPEVRAMAGICFYPFSEIPQLLTALSRSVCELACSMTLRHPDPWDLFRGAGGSPARPADIS